MIGFSASPASSEGLQIGLRQLAELDGGCRADLSLRNDWQRDFVHFSIDLYILARTGEALERQIVDIAPLPANSTTKLNLPLGIACNEIAELRIAAVPNCRLEGDRGDRRCLANLSAREGSPVPVSIGLKR